MTNLFPLLLLVIPGLCEADEAVISISPGGPILEAEQSNVTLHCGLKSGDKDTITSVIWYFKGIILTQLPDPECREALDVDESSGSGSGESEEFISEFIEHELGSGEEEDNVDLKGLIDDNFLFEVREKRETLNFEGSEEIKDGSGDKLFAEEKSGSGDDIASEYLDVVRLLCDVDPTTLTLASVTRQFSGDYSCAIIDNSLLTEPSSPLEVTVECKLN